MERSAHPSKLPADGAPRCLLPRPNAINKGFTTKIRGFESLCRHLFGDDQLRRNTGVVCAHLPERIFAQHALAPNNGVD